MKRYPRRCTVSMKRGVLASSPSAWRNSRIQTASTTSLTAVSGHAFSDHYVDQTKLWVAGRSLPWRSSRAAVERGSEDTLTLMPQR